MGDEKMTREQKIERIIISLKCGGEHWFTLATTAKFTKKELSVPLIEAIKTNNVAAVKYFMADDADFALDELKNLESLARTCGSEYIASEMAFLQTPRGGSRNRKKNA